MTRFIAILIWNSYIVCSIECEASCFRLLGGAVDSEGLLQINVNNAWKNVCFKSGLESNDNRRAVCHFIDITSQAAVLIREPLLYMDKTNEGGVQMIDLTCQASMDETDACRKLIICCQNNDNRIGKHLSSCSSNWLDTNYCYRGKVVGIRAFLKHNDIQNVRRVWTSSAFKDSCKTNTSYSVITANKLNKCLRTIFDNLDKTYALIEGDSCKWTTEIKCENARTFQLVESKNESLDDLHCVTVEVQNGTRNFSIAHCSSYLPSICLDGKQEIKKSTERPNITTTTTSKNTKRLTTTASYEEIIMLPLYVIAAFVALAVMLRACYQYRKYRKILLERRRMDTMPLPEM